MSTATTSPTAHDPPSTGGSAVLGGLRAAIMLLTRIPAGGVVSAAGRQWAAGWIPLVGAVLGGIGALLLAVLQPRLGGHLGAAVTIGLLLLLTGAIHEDGLADTADALGGGRDRERVIAILKDSRIGTYGALALVLCLLVRIDSLAQLQARAPAAYLLAAVLSRASMVWLMAALPYVTPANVARSADLVMLRPGAVALASVTALGTVAVVYALGWLSTPALATAVATCAAITLLSGWRFYARLGGVTGDFLGAAEQLGEVGILMAVLLAS
jgi:adenosylcobinamide-GDP ribazoletransferase